MLPWRMACQTSIRNYFVFFVVVLIAFLVRIFVLINGKNSKHLATKPADLKPIPSADVNSRWLTWCSMHFMAKVDIPYSTKTPSTGFLCVHLDSITCDLKNKKSSSCPRELWELQDFYWEIHGGFFERTKNSEACGMSLKVQCTCCTENRPVTCFFLYFLRVKS